jgi:hypothetical protein
MRYDETIYSIKYVLFSYYCYSVMFSLYILFSHSWY